MKPAAAERSGGCEAAGPTRNQTRGAARAAPAFGPAGAVNGHDEIAFEAQNPGLARGRRMVRWIVDRVPDALPAEQLFDHNLAKNESRQGIAAHRDPDSGEFAQPGIGDHGAEQIDVEHAPRPQMEQRPARSRDLRLRGRAVPSGSVEPAERHNHKA